jgi:hypothetical protein
LLLRVMLTIGSIPFNSNGFFLYVVPMTDFVID